MLDELNLHVGVSSNYTIYELVFDLLLHVLWDCYIYHRLREDLLNELRI